MISLLLATTAVKFPGGTPNDLVHFIQTSSKKDTFIVQVVPPKEGMKELSFDVDSPDEMNTAFKAKYDLRIVPGGEMIFTDERIPMELLAGLGGSAVTGPASFAPDSNGFALRPSSGEKKPLPAEAIVDGKVTFKTDAREALDVGSLISASFGKPLTIHWTYMEDLPYMEVQGETIPVFLQHVAKAVGAKFRDTPKAYALEFSPEEFRRRAVRSLASFKPTITNAIGDMQLSKAKLASSAISAMSSQELTTLFESPGGRVTIPITSGNGVAGPANAYLLALEQMPAAQPAQDDAATQPQGRQGRRQQQQQNQGRQVASVLRNLDTSRVATLTLSAQFQVQLAIPIVDRQGRPAGYIRL